MENPVAEKKSFHCGRDEVLVSCGSSLDPCQNKQGCKKTKDTVRNIIKQGTKVTFLGESRSVDDKRTTEMHELETASQLHYAASP